MEESTKQNLEKAQNVGSSVLWLLAILLLGIGIYKLYSTPGCDLFESFPSFLAPQRCVIQNSLGIPDAQRNQIQTPIPTPFPRKAGACWTSATTPTVPCPTASTFRSTSSRTPTATLKDERSTKCRMQIGKGGDPVEHVVKQSIRSSRRRGVL